MKPLPFQKQDIKLIEWFGCRGLIAWDPGLGKTFATLLLLQRNDFLSPMVVICPASVKYQWAREAERLIGQTAYVCEGETGNPIPKEYRLVVINYDILTKPKVRKGKPTKGKDWLFYLKKWKPSTVVMDEIQYTSNAKSKRTMSCVSLSRTCRHVIGLSATPFLNRPIEMFPGLRMIRPDVFRSRFQFAQRYCNPTWTPWGWEYKGASNSAELHDVLVDNMMVRQRKLDVLDQFPPKVRNVVSLPLKDRADYTLAASNFRAWLIRKDPDKYQQLKKKGALNLFKVGCLIRLAAKLKMRYVNEWVNNFLSDSDEKLIVFAHHRKAIESISQHSDYKHVIVDGSVTGRKRTAAVTQFVDDNKTRLFIANTQCAGIGMDGLQKAACNVAFAELPFQPGCITQAEDRAWRLGALRKVWVWYLVAGKTIEERLCEILQEKQDGLANVMDGGTVEGDLDILDQLLFEFGE